MELITLQNCCRLCFLTKNENISIFANTTTGLNIAQTIEKYFQSELNQVNQIDLLPKIVCVECWVKTEAFHVFYESVKLARENYLRKIQVNCVKTDAPLNAYTIQNVFVQCDGVTKPFIIQNYGNQIWLEQPLITNSDPIQTAQINNDGILEYQKDLSVNASSFQTEPLQNVFNDEIVIPDYFDMACDLCSTTFESLKQAQTHYLEEHKIATGYVKCCGMKLKINSQIKDHISWHLDPNVFRCNMCEISFKSKALLYHHNMRHENRYVCEICGKNFPKKKSLTLHREIHDPEPKYKCEICEKRFSVEVSLKQHMRIMHEPQEVEGGGNSDTNSKTEKKAQCTICSAWLCDMKKLKHHMLTHTDPVKCDQCGAKLLNQQSLYSHNRRVHFNGGINHKCHICRKSFRSLSDLNDHINVHTNAKKHKCSYCYKTFNFRTAMYKHQKTMHVDEWSADKAKKLAAKAPASASSVDQRSENLI